MVFRHCVVECECAESMTPWRLWYSRGTCKVFRHCALANVCLNSTTEKTACHIDCIDEVCVSRARAEYECADDLASQRSGCIGGTGTFGRPDPRTAYISNAYLGNTYKQTLCHNGHKQSCLHLYWKYNVHWNMFNILLQLNKSKARALIGQLPIYYLPMGEWWRKLARAQSCTRHFLLPLYLWYWKKVLSVKGCVIHIETEDSIQQSDFFLKEKNLHWMICTRHSATRWQHTRYSSAVCEQNWKFFSFDYGNGTRLSGYGWNPCPVHGTFVGVDGVPFLYGTTAVLTKTPIVFYLGQFGLHSDWNSHILEIRISVPNQ